MAEKEYIGKTDWVFIVNLIYGEINKYVKAVEGKGLSTNDFTTDLKTKLSNIDLTQYSTTEEMNTAINAAIAGITGLHFEKVDSYEDLPEEGETNTIYLVPNSGTAPDIYDEYYWDANTEAYEKFGSTRIDLSNYLQKTDVVEIATSELQAAWDAVFGS